MNILIVEDDTVSGTLLKTILAPYGNCDIVVDGNAAVEAFRQSLGGTHPYTLVCLDIMLPGLDGQYVLRRIRKMEEDHGIGGLDGVKVVMITALGDHRSIMEAFRSQCEGYIVKPIRKNKVLEQLRGLGLIVPTSSRTVSTKKPGSTS